MTLPGCMAPDGAEPCEAYTAMRNLVQQMVDAIHANGIDSQELTDETGAPVGKWHEEWCHYATTALQNH